MSSAIDTSIYSSHSGYAVTPGSGTIPATRAVYVGGAGDLVVRMARDGSTLTFKAVGGGTLLPICVDQITASSTATFIVALQ